MLLAHNYVAAAFSESSGCLATASYGYFPTTVLTLLFRAHEFREALPKINNYFINLLS